MTHRRHDALLEQPIQAWADALDSLREEVRNLRETVRNLSEASDAPHPLDQPIEVDTTAPNATGHALEVVDRAAHRVDPKHRLWDLRELITAIDHDYVRRMS